MSERAQSQTGTVFVCEHHGEVGHRDHCPACEIEFELRERNE